MVKLWCHHYFFPFPFGVHCWTAGGRVVGVAWDGMERADANSSEVWKSKNFHTLCMCMCVYVHVYVCGVCVWCVCVVCVVCECGVCVCGV